MAHPYRLDVSADAIALALGADPGGDVWVGGSVVPGGYAPVIVREGGRLRLVPRQWGVPPPPRGERVVWCTVPGRPVMALAGIWRDSEVPSFAIVTVDAEGILAGARDAAMPVVLDPPDYRNWLSTDWKDAQNLIRANLDVMPVG